MKISALALVAVLALSIAVNGCASTTEQSEPAGSPGAVSPTPAGPASVDNLIVESDGIVLMAGEVEVARLSATDTYATVVGLTKALGDPTVTDFPEAECTSSYTRYGWGDAIVLDDRATDFVGDYSARFFSAEYTNSQTGQRVGIRGPGGEVVGDDLSAYLTTADPALVEGFAESAIVVLERGWDDLPFAVGVAAFTEDGVVNNMGMPIAVNSGLDC